jgi:hypothetical protein
MAADSQSTDYADRVLREAMAAVTGGLDPSVAEEALTSTTQAIARQMKALEDKDYAKMSPDQVARAVAHTTKAADVLFRLVEFARGKPGQPPRSRHGLAPGAQRRAAAHGAALDRRA